jgi:hypothetical protein
MKNMLLIFIIIGIALIFNVFNIRFCPFFNLFNIPCACCGMTRAAKLILEGKIIESFKYNILALPLLITIIIYFILYVINRGKLNIFVTKNKYLIIIISFLIMVITWIININNELLY